MLKKIIKGIFFGMFCFYFIPMIVLAALVDVVFGN